LDHLGKENITILQVELKKITPLEAEIASKCSSTSIMNVLQHQNVDGGDIWV